MVGTEGWLSVIAVMLGCEVPAAVGSLGWYLSHSNVTDLKLGSWAHRAATGYTHSLFQNGKSFCLEQL